MKLSHLFPALAAAALLTGCVTPVGPVQVTRFHVADLTLLGKGTISVEPAPDTDGNSIEWQTYKAAVMRQLVRIGYAEAGPGAGAQIAHLKVSRSTIPAASGSGPVSVGLGGSTGSYGSGVGLGVGINLSPKPKDQVATELAVSILDRTSGSTLWEGRASFTVSTASPLAGTALAAPKMSEALFLNFPGQSGETIEVK